jgi:hypothetical protein
MIVHFLLCCVLTAIFCQGKPLESEHDDSPSQVDIAAINQIPSVTNKPTSTVVSTPLLSIPSPWLGRKNVSTITTSGRPTFGWLDNSRRTTQTALSSLSAQGPISSSSDQGLTRHPVVTPLPSSGETSPTTTTFNITALFPYLLTLPKPITAPISYETTKKETTNTSIPYVQSFGSTITQTRSSSTSQSRTSTSSQTQSSTTPSKEFWSRLT